MRGKSNFSCRCSPVAPKRQCAVPQAKCPSFFLLLVLKHILLPEELVPSLSIRSGFGNGFLAGPSASNHCSSAPSFSSPHAGRSQVLLPYVGVSVDSLLFGPVKSDTSCTSIRHFMPFFPFARFRVEYCSPQHVIL